MDGSHFDALTKELSAPGSRRRALGGLFAGALGLLSIQTDEGAAKKTKPCPPCKKRKQGKCKKNRPDGAACPGGECRGGNCIATASPPGACPAGRVSCDGQCRLTPGGACNSHAECCSNYCYTRGAYPGECYPSCLGKTCTQDADCCVNVGCIAATCGGCARTEGFCQNGKVCCYSECHLGDCFSFVGERCASRFDCAGYQPCIAGKCSCYAGWDCCFDTDCAAGEYCQGGTCGTCPSGTRFCPLSQSCRECCAKTDCGLIEDCVDGTCQGSIGPG